MGMEAAFKIGGRRAEEGDVPQARPVPVEGPAVHIGRPAAFAAAAGVDGAERRLDDRADRKGEPRDIDVQLFHDDAVRCR